MRRTVLRIDAFTRTVNQGNPAGVVLNGDDYNSQEMQEIAREVGFNETVFICASEKADSKLRYFTPGHETPLCGHATMGAVFALSEGKGDRRLQIETGAGVLPVDYNDQDKKITMQQAKPKFLDFKGDRLALCKSLGIQLQDIHPDLPIQYGNTGSWTLLLPVVHSDVLDKMQPNSTDFPNILKEMPKSSIHPFALCSREAGTFYARHFSSPFSGTTEDSVTGTASGVMGAYSLNHIYTKEKNKEITIHQGKHVQSEGTVWVQVFREALGEHKVIISGNACYNGEFDVGRVD
ncbi:PhzF family phenazine biosynthesis protein [Candidatus Enterococcus mansonii]|uniref:PhzF family phenazine biosynthesis protein n=1 Tax=Candidatus Enterococcus mansonii TaxID=1834181 RepID=A0A242CJJ0_9ENTE|nr:PhzF family phenazine biosynthesis isomerase [Enterococcus sp. 4G2_DIV0659]OTO10406.1 hypothetical protein A5880_001090 [Enterococcus sp. 4G2_DIV0659]